MPRRTIVDSTGATGVWDHLGRSVAQVASARYDDRVPPPSRRDKARKSAVRRATGKDAGPYAAASSTSFRRILVRPPRGASFLAPRPAGFW